MPHPPAEKIFDEEFDKVLAELGVLLQNLPSDLPRKDASESAFSTFLEPFVLDQKYSECCFSVPLPPALDLSFVVDPDINIAAPALLDLVAPESSIDTSTIPKQTASATPAAREDVQDVDCDW
ncbi:hypothetical protein DFH08DRAFT_814212 [Mycena albidolilacea]|uniref:Uncharacterized protein n=1 Tax=Mycena albidolilacea TaxID=1033008 RepID=A0AAD6ZRI6_9AGAR|nr:hypothetical protein DFH08DRAFT_814212 [Mycena albidolilacea]